MKQAYPSVVALEIVVFFVSLSVFGGWPWLGHWARGSPQHEIELLDLKRDRNRVANGSELDPRRETEMVKCKASAWGGKKS